MRVYMVSCSFKNSKLVTWSQQYTAKSKADAVRQAKRGSTLGNEALYVAVLKNESRLETARG